MNSTNNVEAIRGKYSPGKLRIWIAVVCLLAYMIAFFDRANIGILIADPDFTTFFGITTDKSAQGMLMTAFLLCYGISCFFAGPVTQRFGPRLTLGVGLFFWAVVIGIMGCVSLAALLLACRALLGLTEAVLGPCVSKLIQTWFPVHERAKANGAWYVGLLIAQTLTMPLIAWWIALVGWRGSFFILGAMGLIPVVFCYYFVYDHPSQHPKITEEEVEYICGGEDAAPESSGNFTFLKKSNFWYAVIIYAVSNAGIWGFLVWIPTYFKATLGFSWSAMGLLSALPYLCGSVSVMILMPIMDKINRRALFTFIGCFGFAVLLFLAMNAGSATSAVAILTLAMAVVCPVHPALFTILQNVMSKKELATSIGFFNGFSYVFASAVPYAMGALYNSTGSLTSGFYFIGILAIIGVLASIPLVKRQL